jgi:Zn-dependent protease with chaperone function
MLLSLTLGGIGNVLHLLFTVDGISMLATRHSVVSQTVGRAIGWMILDLEAASQGRSQMKSVGIVVLLFFMLPTLLTVLTWAWMAAAKATNFFNGLLAPAPDPAVARIAEDLSAKLGIRAPAIRTRNVDSAFLETRTPWFLGRSRIFVSPAVMLQLSPAEAQAAIGHELGHVKHDATAIRLTRWLSSLLLFPCNVFAVLLDTEGREKRADAVAARLVGNPDTVATALMKVALGGIFGLGRRNGSAGKQPVSGRLAARPAGGRGMAAFALLASLLQPELILGYAHPLLRERLEALTGEDGPARREQPRRTKSNETF